MKLTPVTPAKTTTDAFISMYDRGYMRVNKRLTNLLGLSPGDEVGFYTTSNGEYVFGRLKGGYAVRQQSNVKAMFFNASAMATTLRKAYGLPATGRTTLHIDADIKINIDDQTYYPIANEKAVDET